MVLQPPAATARIFEDGASRNIRPVFRSEWKRGKQRNRERRSEKEKYGGKETDIHKERACASEVRRRPEKAGCLSVRRRPSLHTHKLRTAPTFVITIS